MENSGEGRSKREKAWIIKLAVVTLSCFVAIVIVFDVLYFPVKTWLWHRDHENPIEWNQLEITVPSDLVVMNQEYNGANLQFGHLEDPYGSALFFEQGDVVKAPYKTISDIKLGLEKSGKQNVEVLDCPFEGENCMELRFAKAEIPETILTDYLLFPDRGLKITFRGTKGYRHYFTQMIGDMKFTGAPPQSISGDGPPVRTR